MKLLFPADAQLLQKIKLILLTYIIYGVIELTCLLVVENLFQIIFFSFVV